MMMSEFTERTGFESSAEEYEKIEEQYYNFDGDKDAFCSNWLKQGGILRCCKERALKIEQLNSKILELEHMSRMEDKKLQQRIADLEAQLDRELDWKPYKDKPAPQPSGRGVVALSHVIILLYARPAHPLHMWELHRVYREW